MQNIEYIVGSDVALTWIKSVARRHRLGFSRDELESTEVLPSQRCSLAQCDELSLRDMALHRRHAAIGASDDVLPGHELGNVGDHLCDLLGRLDRVGRDVDNAN